MAEHAGKPKVRFAGFTEAWEQRKFEKIAIRSSAMAVCSRSLPGVEYEDIISEQGILNKDIKTKRAVKIGIKFLPGDVLFGKLRPYLKNWLLPDFTGVAVGDFWVLQPSEIDSQYLYYLIQTPAFQEVSNQSTGTKMPRADWNLVANSMFFLPQNDDEQTCIGTFFRQLDRLITLHQCNCNMATRPCEWSSGLRAIAWEQRKLGDLAEFNPKAELPTNFEYVDLESVVGTELINHRTQTKYTAPSRAQRLAQYGDLFYQLVRPYQKNNYLFELNSENFVFSTGYAQLRPSVDGYFLMSLVQNEYFVQKVLDNCTGTSYPAINVNDLAEINVYTSLKKSEQARIGTFFRQLDRLITLHQRKHILLT